MSPGHLSHKFTHLKTLQAWIKVHRKQVSFCKSVNGFILIPEEGKQVFSEIRLLHKVGQTEY